MRIYLLCLTLRANLYTSDAKIEIYRIILMLKPTPLVFIYCNINILDSVCDRRGHLLEIDRIKWPIIGGLISEYWH